MPLPEAIRAATEPQGLAVSLLVRAGSKAYGIEVASSDDDFLGVYTAPLRSFVSLDGLASETLAGNGPDYTLHELGKFCRLALKGNPAILETLWNPDVVASDAWGRELVAMRRRFLHRKSLDVYLAYAEAQLRKMKAGRGLHAKGGTYNPKYGAHLIRLLHAGIDLAGSGEVTVRVGSELAATLREIRSGARSLADVVDLARPLTERLQGLCAANALPERPDVEAVNDLVVRARLARSA
jgi:predicted nucleotidyltransferase